MPAKATVLYRVGRHARKPSCKRVVALLLLAPMLTACGFLGPGSIEHTRGNYNVAIQSTNDEQLLLNLVRLRYRDTPFFLLVNSVTSQLTFEASAAADATIVEGGGEELAAGAGLAYEERPTISYVPLQGEEFVRRFLSPVTIATILLMNSSGWRLDRVLRLTVQRLNGLKNAPSASGPTPARPPEFARFVEVASTLEALEKANQVELGYALRDGERVPVLRIVEQAAGSAETERLRRRLGLDLDLREYPITLGTGAPSRESLNLQSRSLLGIMFYLSQSVEVPPDDQAQGLVTVTRTQTGEPFDWKEVTGDLMRVRSRDSRPAGASVAVRYRRGWFYVDDADLDSKSSFALLAQIFALQGGGVAREGPVLTLPVGQ